MNSIKIIIATGGTGGHILCSLAFAEEMIKRQHKVLLIADSRFNAYKIHNFEVEFIPITSIKSGFFTFCKNFLISCIKSIKIIRKYKPNIVVGFGAYPSSPTLLASYITSTKIILHEANVIIGKANHLFYHFASYLAISMPIKNLTPSQKLVLTGMPINSNLESKATQNNTSDCKILKILITGGSQGSMLLDKIIPKSILQLSQDLEEKNLYIVQQCKMTNVKLITDLYKKARIDAQIDTFFFDMTQKIIESDIVICRSGSGTLTQVSMAKKLAIYIPFKNSALNHQFENANYMIEKNAAIMVQEEELSSELLYKILKYIITKPNEIKKFGENAQKALCLNATKKLSGLVELAAKNK